MNAELATHWHALTAPLLPDYARREAEYQQLVAAYSATSRHYHNLAHVAKLLAQVARFLVRDAPVLNLASWYHDALYNVLRHDNEAKSAD